MGVCQGCLKKRSPALVVCWGWLVGRGPALHTAVSRGISIVLGISCVSPTCVWNGTGYRCPGAVSLADFCLTLVVIRLLELQKSVSMLNWL